MLNFMFCFKEAKPGFQITDPVLGLRTEMDLKQRHGNTMGILCRETREHP